MMGSSGSVLVYEDRPRGQNSVALALKTAGHSLVLEAAKYYITVEQVSICV